MQSDVISGTKMPSSDVDVNLLETIDEVIRGHHRSLEVITGHKRSLEDVNLIETIDEVKWRSRRRVRASEEPDRTINGNQRQ